MIVFMRLDVRNIIWVLKQWSNNEHYHLKCGCVSSKKKFFGCEVRIRVLEQLVRYFPQTEYSQLQIRYHHSPWTLTVVLGMPSQKAIGKQSIGICVTTKTFVFVKPLTNGKLPCPCILDNLYLCICRSFCNRYFTEKSMQ